MRSLFPFLVLCLLAGCTAEEQRRIVLAQYDFSGSRSERLTAELYGDDFGRHLFDDTWLKDTSPGLWATGDSAAAWFHLAGSSAVLRLVCSTHPDLSAAGQSYVVEMNGVTVGRDTLDAGWDEHLLEIGIPDAVLVAGLNRLVLRPSLDLADVGLAPPGAARHRAVFLRRLEIAADLAGGDLARWERTREGRIERPPWEMVAVAGSPRAGRDDAAAAPDVLFFVLDAMRYDRAGFNGYARATTPQLDRLAADAVRFTRVHANASYTRCAMPSLLTGLPWHEHNVVDGIWDAGDAMADSLVTMAEVFRAAGYSTLGVSQNPNFSVATRTDQGFDEFHEMWKREDYEELDPEAPERLFVGRLGGGLPPEPVFAFLHLLPPHLPYAPGAEHDLWRGHDGCGVEVARLEDVRALERGDEDLPDCLPGRVSDLYDGNLHRIDASVGRMLAAWAALDRQRELVVVVTADHGEGMGEHGLYDHGTTVYDEMTHIPLLVWPARAVGDWERRAGAFFSIEDVMPMLLNIVDLEMPRDGRWPRRFVSLLAGDPEPRRFILMRTMGDSPVYGVRTPGELAVCDGFRQQELWRGASGGLSGTDLRMAEPERYGELLGILHGALRRGAWMRREPLPSILPPADAETLRSLGY